MGRLKHTKQTERLTRDKRIDWKQRQMPHSSPSPLRLGIVGAGVIVRDTHLRTVRDYPDYFEVVAIADPDIDKAAERASEVPGRARIYADHAELCADERVDAILIAVPPFLSVPVAMDCLASGKPVLSEKPMGHTEADARRLLDAASAANGPLMIAENFFFIPGYVRLREIARSGDWPFGPPLLVELHQFWKMTPRSIPQFWNSPWRHDERLTYGYLMEGGCHTVNPLREAFGMPEPGSIHTRLLSADARLGRHDTLLAHAKLEGGSAAQITMSYGLRSAPSPLYQVYAPEGTLCVEREKLVFQPEGGERREEALTFPYGAPSAFHAELLHFHDVVVNGAPLEITAEQAFGDVCFVQRLLDVAPDRQE